MFLSRKICKKKSLQHLKFKIQKKKQRVSKMVKQKRRTQRRGRGYHQRWRRTLRQQTAKYRFRQRPCMKKRSTQRKHNYIGGTFLHTTLNKSKLLPNTQYSVTRSVRNKSNAKKQEEYNDSGDNEDEEKIQFRINLLRNADLQKSLTNFITDTLNKGGFEYNADDLKTIETFVKIMRKSVLHYYTISRAQIVHFLKQYETDCKVVGIPDFWPQIFKHGFSLVDVSADFICEVFNMLIENTDQRGGADTPVPHPLPPRPISSTTVEVQQAPPPPPPPPATVVGTTRRRLNSSERRDYVHRNGLNVIKAAGVLMIRLMALVVIGSLVIVPKLFIDTGYANLGPKVVEKIKSLLHLDDMVVTPSGPIVDLVQNDINRNKKSDIRKKIKEEMFQNKDIELSNVDPNFSLKCKAGITKLFASVQSDYQKKGPLNRKFHSSEFQFKAAYPPLNKLYNDYFKIETKAIVSADVFCKKIIDASTLGILGITERDSTNERVDIVIDKTKATNEKRQTDAKLLFNQIQSLRHYVVPELVKNNVQTYVLNGNENSSYYKKYFRHFSNDTDEIQTFLDDPRTKNVLQSETELFLDSAARLIGYGTILSKAVNIPINYVYENKLIDLRHFFHKDDMGPVALINVLKLMQQSLNIWKNSFIDGFETTEAALQHYDALQKFENNTKKIINDLEKGIVVDNETLIETIYNWILIWLHQIWVVIKFVGRFLTTSTKDVIKSVLSPIFTAIPYIICAAVFLIYVLFIYITQNFDYRPLALQLADIVVAYSLKTTEEPFIEVQEKLKINKWNSTLRGIYLLMEFIFHNYSKLIVSYFIKGRLRTSNDWMAYMLSLIVSILMEYIGWIYVCAQLEKFLDPQPAGDANTTPAADQNNPKVDTQTTTPAGAQPNPQVNTPATTPAASGTKLITKKTVNNEHEKVQNAENKAKEIDQRIKSLKEETQSLEAELKKRNEIIAIGKAKVEELETQRSKQLYQIATNKEEKRKRLLQITQNLKEFEDLSEYEQREIKKMINAMYNQQSVESQGQENAILQPMASKKSKNKNQTTPPSSLGKRDRNSISQQTGEVRNKHPKLTSGVYDLRTQTAIDSLNSTSATNTDGKRSRHLKK